MVSLARAVECPGRAIEHIEPIKLKGRVSRVTQHDVWVRDEDGAEVPCIPENMQWVSTLSDNLREAILTDTHYEDPQVFYMASLYGDEADEDLDYDESIQGISVVGSSATANDDGENHPLYIIAPAIRRVYPVRINALRDTAWEIEEVLGWSQS